MNVTIKYDKEIIKSRRSYLKDRYPSLLTKENQGEINIQTEIKSIQWVFDNKKSLRRHLRGSELPVLVQGQRDNFDKLVSLLNLARFNMKYGNNKTVSEILKSCQNYFKNSEIASGQTKKSKSPAKLLSGKSLRGMLFKDLQIIWLFPEFKDDLSEAYTHYQAMLWDSVKRHNSKPTQKVKCTFAKHFRQAFLTRKDLDDFITQEMFYMMSKEIFNCFKSEHPKENHLFNVKDLAFLDSQMATLKSFPLQQQLGFYKHQKITFDLSKLQERMKTYSEDILDETFPFDSSKFIIAGGFPTNIICGLQSIYTDLDIYIYKDFNLVCQNIVTHLRKKYKVELTHNPCIVNVILVGKKMNLQLINSKEVGQEVIDKFDLSHSQAMISDWNKVEVTLEAYRAYLTGQFEINSNVRINPSRILKAYTKGFEIDDHSIRKAIDTKIDNSAKDILSELKEAKDKTLVLKKHLKSGSVNHKILTKAVYLPDDIYSTLNKQGITMKDHLEKNTCFKYLKLQGLEVTKFKPLEIYGSKYYGYDYNGNKSDEMLKNVVQFIIGDRLGKINPLSVYPLKALMTVEGYNNRAEEKTYSIPAIVSANSLKKGYYNNFYLEIHENHPLYEHLTKCEEYVQKDLLAKENYVFKSRMMRGKSVVFGCDGKKHIIPGGDKKILIQFRFNNPTYTVVKGKEKKEFNAPLHLQPRGFSDEKDKFLENFLEDPMGENVPNVLITLQLARYWEDSTRNMGGITIHLGSKIRVVPSKRNTGTVDICLDDDESDEESDLDDEESESEEISDSEEIVFKKIVIRENQDSDSEVEYEAIDEVD